MENTEQKDFLFRCEWRDRLAMLPNESRLRVYDAITAYALEGVVAELNTDEVMIFGPIRREIDSYQTNVERVHRAKSEGARRAMMKRWHGTEATTPPETSTPVRKKRIRRTKLESRKLRLLQDDSRLGRLNRWMIENTPYIVGHFSELITAEQFDRLLEVYDGELIRDTLINLNKNKKRCRTYANLYITLAHNWLPNAKMYKQQKQLFSRKGRKTLLP